MTKLKNTPWKAKEILDYWAVEDTDGVAFVLGFALDEPTAQAIAALPDTLKRLEELEEDNKRFTDAYEPQQKLVLRLHQYIKELEAELEKAKKGFKSLFNQRNELSNALKQTQAENEKLEHDNTLLSHANSNLKDKIALEKAENERLRAFVKEVARSREGNPTLSIINVLHRGLSDKAQNLLKG